MIKNVYRSACEVPVIIVTFQWNLNFLNRFSQNTQTPNLIKIHPVGAELFHEGAKTDTTKLTVIFRNFAKATTKCEVLRILYGFFPTSTWTSVCDLLAWHFTNEEGYKLDNNQIKTNSRSMKTSVHTTPANDWHYAAITFLSIDPPKTKELAWPLDRLPDQMSDLFAACCQIYIKTHRRQVLAAISVVPVSSIRRPLHVCQFFNSLWVVLTAQTNCIHFICEKAS